MAVLHPEEDGFAGAGRGEAGIAGGGPGVGVVGAGEGGWAAPLVEKVSSAYLTTSWPAAPMTWRKSWPVKGARPKRARTARLSSAMPPGPAGASSSQLARVSPDASKRRQPEADVAGAVAGPVIGGDEARREPVLVAEEGEVGGEVERVEVAAAVAEHGIGEAGCVEAGDEGAGRGEGGEARFDARGVEGGDEDCAGAGSGEIGERAAGEAGARRADLADVLDEDAGERGRGGMEGEEGRGDAVGVEEGDGGGGGEAGVKAGHGFGGERVGERLVDDVAAAPLIEGLNLEHGSSGVSLYSVIAGGGITEGVNHAGKQRLERVHSERTRSKGRGGGASRPRLRRYH